MLADALALLTEAVRHLAAIRRALEAQHQPGPIYVREAADLLGISRATLDRRIADLPATRRPAAAPGSGQRRRYYWADADALMEWWAAISEKPRSRRAPSRVATGGAITDWRAVARKAGNAAP